MTHDTQADTNKQLASTDIHLAYMADTDGPESPPLPPPASGSASAVDTDQPPGEHRKRGGAPVGNSNARRHGLRSPRSAQPDRWIDRQTDEFRRGLEHDVLTVHGEIGIMAAALVHSAVEATRQALAELRELRTAYDKMDPSQRSQKRHAAVRLLDMRDKKIAQLGLAVGGKRESFDDMYRQLKQEATGDDDS
jgi:hypothetical protein